jgi:ABC-type transport system involved in multi-copper enzyme maturation permease subunit
MASAIGTLYLEELKATMRGRFAWLGAAVILLAVGGLAAVGTQDTWLDGYGIVAYFLVPLAFIPLAAGAVASPRANRFVESVFTAPVERRDWFAAKLLVLLTLAAAYYVALVPMMLVYVHYVGLPLLLKMFVIWSAGILVASVAIGSLIGVLFIGRSIAAPVGTGMGILLLYAGLLPLQELMVAQGRGSSRTGHLTLTSPAVLLKNALGFAVASGNIPTTTTRNWISFILVVVAAFVLAAWIFLRAQGVETWEASRAQRWIITIGMATIFLFPILFAETNYDKRAPALNNAPALRGLSWRGSSSLGLATTGGQLPQRCCSPIMNHDEWPSIPTDQNTARDLVILLPVDTKQHITDLRIDIAGENGLQVTADASALANVSQHLETRTYANDLGPVAPDGHHVVNGWVARVPVVLAPTHAWDTGGMRYPLAANAIFNVEGETQPRMLKARAAIEAQIGSALWEMAFAAAIFPFLCFAASIVRWRRTR